MREYAPTQDTEDAARLADALIRQSYLDRRISLRKSKPPYPRFLYRYIGFNSKDLGSVDKLRTLLVGSDLFLSPISEFNDPFDTSGQLKIGPDTGKFRQKLNELRKKAAKTSTQIVNSPAQIMRKFAENPERVAETLNHAVQQAIASAGCCCFTTQVRDIQMWSHYARHHRGLVVQFDLARDIHTFKHILPMTYSDEYPVIDYLQEGDGWVSRMLQQKYRIWEREKEWRITAIGGAGKYWPLAPEGLGGIILGCKMSEEDKSCLYSLLGERDKQWVNRDVRPKLYQCGMKLGAYRLQIARIKH